MPEYRTVIVVAVVAVCATVAACFKVLTPELMGLLGAALTAWIGKKMLDSPGKTNGTTITTTNTPPINIPSVWYPVKSEKSGYIPPGGTKIETTTKE